LRQPRQHFVQRGRVILGTNTGGVENRIGDRGGRTANAKLSDPFCLKRICVVVTFFQQDNIKLWQVHVDRQVVFREIMVDDMAIARIVDDFLFELERSFDWPFFDLERGGDPL